MTTQQAFVRIGVPLTCLVATTLTLTLSQEGTGPFIESRGCAATLVPASIIEVPVTGP